MTDTGQDDGADAALDQLPTSGWTDRHDYDPWADYELRPDHADHELLGLAQQVADRICTRADVPFDCARVFPADLSHRGDAAVYCFGTSAAPVVLIDLDAHTEPQIIDPAAEIRRSVEHELRHALQEHAADGQPVFCENTAEHGDAQLAF